jgi:cobalt-zinc-cadmium efflux system outer membrane protein
MPEIHLFPLRAALLGVAANTLIISVAAAGPAPPFPELLRQAQSVAPRLAEGRAGVEQAEGLARQAAVRPNPTASVLVENFGGSRPYADLGGQTTVQVDQMIELGGKRDSRIAAGRAGLAAARQRSVQTASDFAADLAQAYAAAEACDVRVRLAQDAVAFAQEDVRIADALVRTGKEAEVRALQARAAMEAARAGAQTAEVDRAAAFARLTAMAGVSDPITSIPVGLLAHADRLERPPEPSALASPAYAAAQADRDAAERRVRLEQIKAVPDVTVSLGVRQLAGERATAFIGGVSVPFPLFDQNRGNTAAARGELNAAEARLRSARLDSEAEARVAVARLNVSQARLSSAAAGDQAASEAYRLTRLGYQGGKLPLSEVLTAQRALGDARNQVLQARLERLDAETALARLQGVVPFGDSQ